MRNSHFILLWIAVLLLGAEVLQLRMYENRLAHNQGYFIPRQSDQQQQIQQLNLILEKEVDTLNRMHQYNP